MSGRPRGLAVSACGHACVGQHYACEHPLLVLGRQCSEVRWPRHSAGAIESVRRRCRPGYSQFLWRCRDQRDTPDVASAYELGSVIALVSGIGRLLLVHSYLLLLHRHRPPTYPSLAWPVHVVSGLTCLRRIRRSFVIVVGRCAGPGVDSLQHLVPL